MTLLPKISIYVLLSLVALLLVIPMIWMTIGAFAPQTELKASPPLSGMVSGLNSETLTSASGIQSWARAYLTSANFYDPANKAGLFDVTAMPAGEFRRAPVHNWFFKWLPTPADPASLMPGGRLILWFENTFFTAAMVTLLSVMFSAMAGYAFAKFIFPGREILFWLIIATIMIPGQVTIIPLFLLVTRGLDWHNSLWAIILPQVAAPVGIFLMRQYIRGLPSALEEAARIDGCSEIGIFTRVILPLCKPVLAVWAIFTFIGAWKAFLWPLVITSSQDLYLLEVGLKTLQFNAGPQNIGIVMAAALLASIPMILTFFVFQKYLTKGLTIGGVKG